MKRRLSESAGSQTLHWWVKNEEDKKKGLNEDDINYNGLILLNVTIVR